MPAVQRGFVEIGERQVHYRYMGAGPPVVLLHQSPRNSAELLPLMQVLAPHFLVIAPDTPGYGQSDPVAPSHTEPSIDVFANALVIFLDALGLERVALFGSHTGAIIAVRVASRYPQRIAALVANGILMTTPAERSDKADRYLPEFLPRWDGSHLTWLWSRLRDQLMFYPWFQRDPAYRIEWSQPLDDTDAGALDLLESGDNYRGAYGAVLRYDIAQDLPSITLPTLLVVAKPDALSRFVDSYPTLRSCVAVNVVPRFEDVAGATLDFLRRQALVPAQLQPPKVIRINRLRSSFLALADGQMHLRRSQAGAGRTLLVLHDLGGSATGLDPLLGGIIGSRLLVAPDLPGHGESRDLTATTPDEIAALLLQALDELQVKHCDMLAVGASAAIVAALLRRDAKRLGRIALVEPIPGPAHDKRGFAGPLLPDLTADNAGSHLTRAWMYLRDRALYFPWHDRSTATQLAQARPPRPVELQRALIDLLKSRPGLPSQLEAALVSLDLSSSELRQSHLLARPGTAIRRPGATAAGTPILDLPEELFQWGPVVLRALDA
jgi:haloalkane dehalogenase